MNGTASALALRPRIDARVVPVQQVRRRRWLAGRPDEPERRVAVVAAVAATAASGSVRIRIRAT